MAERRYEFTVSQSGLVVAEGKGRELEDVSREAWRAVAQYRGDGMVEMEIFRRRPRGVRERVVRLRMGEVSFSVGSSP